MLALALALAVDATDARRPLASFGSRNLYREATQCEAINYSKDGEYYIVGYDAGKKQASFGFTNKFATSLKEGDDLLQAIDDADRELWGERDRAALRSSPV